MFNEDEEYGIRFTAALARRGFSDVEILDIWEASAVTAGLPEDSEQGSATPDVPRTELDYRWDEDEVSPWLYVLTPKAVLRWTELDGWTVRPDSSGRAVGSYEQAPESLINRAGPIPERLLTR